MIKYWKAPREEDYIENYRNKICLVLQIEPKTFNANMKDYITTQTHPITTHQQRRI